MSDYPVSYSEPRKEDFWCEQDAKWYPECECEEQCFECGLVQSLEELEPPTQTEVAI
nr:hypothetical protein 38 [Balneolaceae bacterium]